MGREKGGTFHAWGTLYANVEMVPNPKTRL